MSKKHMGSSMDDFLKEEGIFEEAQTLAVKEVVAWQLAEAMKKKKISKARMAKLSRRAAARWTACWIRGTTSRSRACNGRPRWLDAG